MSMSTMDGSHCLLDESKTTGLSYKDRYLADLVSLDIPQEIMKKATAKRPRDTSTSDSPTGSTSTASSATKKKKKPRIRLAILDDDDEVVHSTTTSTECVGSPLNDLRRSCPEVMCHIYAYLPLMDRFQLRHVDAFWWNDQTALFCQAPVGVYGHHNWELQEAWAYAKRYLEFDGTNPLSTKLYNPSTPLWAQWQKIPRICVTPQGMARFYSSKTQQYDIDVHHGKTYQELANLIAQGTFAHLKATKDYRTNLEKEIQTVNRVCRNKHKDMQKVERHILHANTTSNGFAMLFRLFQQHKRLTIYTTPFFRTTERRYHDLAKQKRFPYQFIVTNNDNQKEEKISLQSLRPGVKLCWKHPDTGTVTRQFLKQCERCHKWTDTVRAETCGKISHCHYRTDVCAKCTTKRTCVACGTDHCGICSRHAIVTCASPKCRHTLCSLESSSTTACGYVMPLPSHFETQADYWEWLVAEHRAPRRTSHVYCPHHKPDGALPLPPKAVALERQRRGEPIFVTTENTETND
ncbi:expressed unknown protein [Seminavis robusta]|uniref:Uncharacterized protein n=1 Tax=Seminavis robusta TaxID=568900 RepID=A0A9N8HLB0_9STRA|nr:expressed unknown protein [Seminavis robusta]|eukprot:Sro808_g205450.1 n/a (520) ;mRNA; r:32688-34247